MLDVAFWLEYRRRADPVIWLAFLNPPLLGLHVLTTQTARPALEVWLLGLGVTFLVCLFGAVAIYFATILAIRRGVQHVTREKMWLDIIRRGPFMRIVAPKREDG